MCTASGCAQRAFTSDATGKTTAAGHFRTGREPASASTELTYLHGWTSRSVLRHCARRPRGPLRGWCTHAGADAARRIRGKGPRRDRCGRRCRPGAPPQRGYLAGFPRLAVAPRAGVVVVDVKSATLGFQRPIELLRLQQAMEQLAEIDRWALALELAEVPGVVGKQTCDTSRYTSLAWDPYRDVMKTAGCAREFQRYVRRCWEVAGRRAEALPPGASIAIGREARETADERSGVHGLLAGAQEASAPDAARTGDRDARGGPAKHSR